MIVKMVVSVGWAVGEGLRDSRFQDVLDSFTISKSVWINIGVSCGLNVGYSYRVTVVGR